MLIFNTIHSLNKLKQAGNPDGRLGRPRSIWNRLTIASRPVVQSRGTHALDVYSSLGLRSGPDRYAPLFTLQLPAVHPERPEDWTSCFTEKTQATSKCARQIKRLIDVNSLSFRVIICLVFQTHSYRSCFFRVIGCPSGPPSDRTKRRTLGHLARIPRWQKGHKKIT